MPPFRSNWSVDYEDLSEEVDAEDDFELLQLESDRDWDALLQDDLTPTRVVPPKLSALPWLGQLAPPPARSRPPSLTRTPPPASAPMVTAPAPAAYYAAPRTPPPSYRPAARPSSIAPVMVTPAEAGPARVWPMFLGAGVVGCAAILVATVPLLLKGAAFQRAASVTHIEAAAAAPPARVTPKPKAAQVQAKRDSRSTPVSTEVLRIEDLPASSDVLSLDDLPVAAAIEEAAPRPATPKPAVARFAPRAPVMAPKASPSRDGAGATLHLVAAPPVHAVVDGRPVGMTPKSVRLEPGAHTVVFMGPGGREARAIDLPAGADKTMAIRF